MRILYLPFSIVAKRISARLGQKTFERVWAKIDSAPPPKPRTGQGSTAKVITAQALEAGVMAGVAAGVDRTFARFFHHLLGIWPGKPPKPKPESEAAE